MEATGGGEFAAIARLVARLPTPPPGETWIGDDAAVLAGGLLAAADVVVEGVHFELSTSSYADVGWRAVAVNVSDIAAMGGRPAYLLVTVAGPRETDLEALYDGIAAAAAASGCAVVGGDLAGASTLSVSVTVLGTTDGRPAVLRSGARAGDVVHVTGTVGHGLASGYRERPTPRLEEGLAAAAAGATAMIDVSDGFLADLLHILEASGVGCELGDVPLAPGVAPAEALGGGEDYELIICGPPEAPLPGSRVGVIVADTSARPAAAGWEHRFS